MKKEYKLSSTFSWYFGLLVNSIALLFFTALFLFSEAGPVIFLILPILLVEVMYVRLPTVVATQETLIIKRWFQEPVIHPISAIADVKRGWSGKGIVTLQNGETISFLPNQLEVMLNFFNYGEHVMQKIKELEEE